MSTRHPHINETTPGEHRMLPGSRWFLLVAGSGQLKTHPLPEGEAIIGRASECHVVIDDRVFSRRHARLNVGREITVQDLGSKNGVLVGGQLVQGGAPVPLADAMGFHIGSFSFVVVAGAGDTMGSASGSSEHEHVVLDPTPAGVSSFVRDVAKTPLSVLILGETGVGKEILSGAIHELSGRTGPLSRINCAALSETLLESELFGHERGAFTGADRSKVGLLEATAQGTVFLDEVGELPLPIQAKLLRAVEAKEIFRLGSTRPTRFDARFIAATNRDLSREISEGRFRADLYFRLASATFRIPPLRERAQAIGSLAFAFLREAAERDQRPASMMAPDVLHALEAHPFPGNVRELKTLMERAHLLAKGRPIQRKHLSFGKMLLPGPAKRAEPEAPALTSADSTDRERIVQAMELCAGNQTRTAKALGISRTTLVQKLKLYRIPRPRD